MKAFLKKIDKLYWGLIIGTLLPIPTFFLGKFFLLKGGTWKGYYNLFFNHIDLRGDIITFSLLGNLLLFYFVFFLWRVDRLAQGLVMITLPLVIYMIYCKM